MKRLALLLAAAILSAPALAQVVDENVSPSVINAVPSTGPTHMRHGIYVAPKNMPKKPTGWHSKKLLRHLGPDRAPSDYRGGPNQDGAFRNACGFAWMRYDDPIVYPGQPNASHLHSGFGNTGVSEKTTFASLSYGNSTCRGGKVNMSAYWVPAMIDVEDPKNPVAIPFDSAVPYYKGWGNWAEDEVGRVIAELPQGLKAVVGSMTNRDPAFTRGYFECWTGDQQGPRGPTIDCPAGTTRVLQTLGFPPCWDGKSLDSPDHKSHLRDWEHGGPGVGLRCPSTHPVTIPFVTFNVWYTIPIGKDGRPKPASVLRLSCDDIDGPGGPCNHGDIWVKWDPAIKRMWHEGCLGGGVAGAPRYDCHAHLLNEEWAMDGRPY